MKNQEIAARVYDWVAKIPRGKVATYKQLAALAGSPNAARLVGQALNHTPENLVIPCYRVVSSSGRLVPGWADQRTRLESEGIIFKDNGEVNLERCLWQIETE